MWVYYSCLTKKTVFSKEEIAKFMFIQEKMQKKSITHPHCATLNFLLLCKQYNPWSNNVFIIFGYRGFPPKTLADCMVIT